MLRAVNPRGIVEICIYSEAWHAKSWWQCKFIEQHDIINTEELFCKINSLPHVYRLFYFFQYKLLYMFFEVSQYNLTHMRLLINYLPLCLISGVFIKSQRFFKYSFSMFSGPSFTCESWEKRYKSSAGLSISITTKSPCKTSHHSTLLCPSFSYHSIFSLLPTLINLLQPISWSTFLVL